MAALVGQVIASGIQVYSDNDTLVNLDTLPNCDVTLPNADASTTAATVALVSLGTYKATLTAAMPGPHEFVWTATGANTGRFPHRDTVNVTSQGVDWWVSLSDVKEQLEKTGTVDDDELAGYIETATRIIVHRCGPMIPTTYTDEAHDGDGSAIMLDHYPVLSVTSVTEYGWGGGGGTVLVAAGGATGVTDGYLLQPKAGALVRVGGRGHWSPGVANVLVTYKAGRNTVPGDVVLGTLLLIQHLWTNAKVGGGGRRPVVAAGDSTTLGTFLLPYQVLEALGPYLKAPKAA